MKKCWIMLGKTGDILSIAPILHHYYKLTGQKQTLMVSKQYAPLLEGFTYIEPYIFDGTFHQLKEALAIAKKNFSDVECLQVYGDGFPFEQKCPSFQQDQWLRAGMLKYFGRIPLIVDNRNTLRGAKILETLKYNPHTRLILIGDHSESSPFSHVESLVKNIEEIALAEKQPTRVIRLSQIRAERFYDLLALYNVADALVTIETAHIHLSAASQIPTLVLSCDDKLPWRGSAKVNKFSFYARYSEYEARKLELFSRLKEVLNGWTPVQGERKKISCVIPIFKPSREMLGKCILNVSGQVDEIIVTMETGGVMPDRTLLGRGRIVVHPKTNIGFGANVNFGVSHATHDTVLILNDDVYLKQDAVEMMLDVMDEKTAIVGMLTRYPNGLIYHSGKERKTDGSIGHPHVDGIGKTHIETILIPKEMENTNGASILVNKKAFNEVGGFDESYKFYCEDDDLAMKVRQAGWKVLYTPFAEGIHDGHQESKSASFDRMKVMVESNKRFAGKWKFFFDLNRGYPGLGRFK